MTNAAPIVTQTAYQKEVFWRDDLRMFFLSWSRRARKSTTFSHWSLRSNMENPGNLNVFVSCNLTAGAELLLKEKTTYDEVLKKEVQMWRAAADSMRAAAEESGTRLETTADGLREDDLDGMMDLFDHNRFETRIWHDRTTYSRTLVIAANPLRAVGYGGNLFLDEVTRTPNMKELMEAVMPFIASNPSMFCRMAGTPPPDDSHYSYELTAPPDGEFPISATGNWYTSRMGMKVHRVTVDDMYAAGIPQYSITDGRKITPDEAREESFDRVGWDRNFRLKYIAGGSASYSIASITAAQRRGKGFCLANHVGEEIFL